MLSLHLEGNELIVCLFIVSMMRNLCNRVRIRKEIEYTVSLVKFKPNSNNSIIHKQSFVSNMVYQKFIEIRDK